MANNMKKRMHFSLIFWGMFFIFSPDISVFDLLPDVIGWFLIVLGLGRLSDIEMRADDAKLLAKRMMLFSAAKLGLSLFMFRFSSSDLLLVTFSYAILEMITVIPLIGDMFKGLDYTAMRVDAPLDSDKLNTAKWYLYVFFVIKNALAVLPTTVALFDSNITGEFKASSWFVNFDAAMRVMMIIAFFMAVLLFIVMLCFFAPFWFRIARNRDLNAKLFDYRQKNVMEIPACMIRKNTSFVLSMFTTGVIFFFDFYLDGTDVLPTFVGFMLIFAGALYAKKRMGHSCTLLMAVSAIGGVISLAAFLYRFIPLTRNSFVIDYGFSSKPYTVALGALTAIFSAIIFILIFRLAGKFNIKYTKYNLPDSLTLYMFAGVILSGFGMLLYCFPDKNTTFVFPSLVFGSAFCGLGAYYFIKLKKQIIHDNKF